MAWWSLLVLSMRVFICFTPLMAFSTSVSMYLLPAADISGGGWEWRKSIPQPAAPKEASGTHPTPHPPQYM